MKKLLVILKSFFRRTQLKSVFSKESTTCISLRQLINQVMIKSLPRNLQLKSFIVNEVEKEMLVSNENNILANVISHLLSTTIVYTNDNSIHVSANLSGNTTWLNIKTNDMHHSRTITNNLRQVKLMTKKIGGSISVIKNNEGGNTLAFTFRNQQAA